MRSSVSFLPIIIPLPLDVLSCEYFPKKVITSDTLRLVIATIAGIHSCAIADTLLIPDAVAFPLLSDTSVDFIFILDIAYFVVRLFIHPNDAPNTIPATRDSATTLGHILLLFLVTLWVTLKPEQECFCSNSFSSGVTISSSKLSCASTVSALSSTGVASVSNISLLLSNSLFIKNTSSAFLLYNKT